MRISFSGTREGMGEAQLRDLSIFLKSHKNRLVIASHGCCMGADVQFHRACREIVGKHLFIAGFPSTSVRTCRSDELDLDSVADPAEPLARNKTIVDTGPDLLIAAPLHNQYEIGGTWNAIHYAQRRGIRVNILLRGENAC